MSFNEMWKKLFASKPASKDVAVKRIQFALLTDRLDIKQETLKDLQQDLIEVISNYFEIDKKSITIDIKRSDECSSLVFNSPIIRARHQRKAAAM